jgi:CHAT domain-containing protein/tetratricopeptide (TPR) repeat protein
MKRLNLLLLICIAILSSSLAHAQNVEAIVKTAKEYFNDGNFEQAALKFETVLPLVEQEYGATDTIYYLEQIIYTGMSFENCSKFEKAIHYYLMAKSILEVSHATSDIRYIVMLNMLALSYYNMGYYEKAIPLIEQAYEIVKAHYTQNENIYQIILTNVGVLNEKTGRYREAEPALQQSLELVRLSEGDKSPGYAEQLQNLAVLYYKMGNYKKAEALMKQAIELAQIVLGKEHSDYFIYLNNLAIIYYAMNDYWQAQPLYLEAIEITKTKMGEDNPDYATLLDNLGLLYFQLGLFELALPLFLNALEIDRKYLGGNQTQYAIKLNNLANLYFKSGNYDEAEPLLKQTVEINNRFLGESHPEYANSLSNLATLYFAMGRYKQADSIYRRAYKVYQNFLMKNTGFLLDKDFEKFLNTFLYRLDIFQTFNCQEKQWRSASGDFAYDIELSRKGILLKSVIGIKTSILESGDTTLISAYINLRSLREKIDKISINAPDENSDNIGMLEAQENELEETILLRSRYYPKAQYENVISWKDIRQNLKPDEAAIEFSCFQHDDGKYPNDSILYCAVLLRSNDTIPHMVYLTEESKLKEAIPPINSSKKINLAYSNDRLYPVLFDTSSSTYKHLLHNLIWEPLDSLLKGTKTIYFAPSGLLNSLSMAAIACPDNTTLMDKYKLVQLSSTRILALPCVSETINDAIIYGGITYDIDTLTLLSNSEKYRKTKSGILANYNSSVSNHRSGFSYLPGTQKEAELIAAKLKHIGIVTKIFSGTNALEESFKSLSEKTSPSVIHLSTHGFYYPDTISDRNRMNTMLSLSGEMQSRSSDDPLLRSGLLMSGANRAWKGLPIPAGVEDGILTAKEVSNMNLMNTELVVLSACQTGQGDIKGSEGVEGLQRGFKMAGVRYLIMSLWEVPDKETTEFMDTFYDNWLGGKEIHEAFRDTQSKMHKIYKDEPFKWGGFVLVE